MVKGQRSAAAAPNKQGVRKVTGVKSTASNLTPKAAAKGAAVADVPSCGACGQTITDGVKALQCDGCQSSTGWKCADCLNLTSDLYDVLVSDAGACLKWFCGACELSIANSRVTPAPDCKLEKMMSMIQKFLDKFEYIDARLDEKTDAIVTVQLETRIKNVEERMIQMEERMMRNEDRLSRPKCGDKSISGFDNSNHK